MINAVRNSKEYDYVIWIDADTFTFRSVPLEFLKTLLPNNTMVTYLGRERFSLNDVIPSFTLDDGAVTPNKKVMIDLLQVEQTYGAPVLVPVGNQDRNQDLAESHVVGRAEAIHEDVRCENLSIASAVLPIHFR